MTLDRDIQPTKCPLSTDNLSFDNRQNDLIKDNRKDNEKDNNSGEFQPTAESSPLAEIQKPEGKGYTKVSKQWLEDNNIEYELIVGNLGEVKATGAKIEVI